MIIRATDASGDWTFGAGKQNYKRGDEAIAQHVNSRIREFKNDCFFNLEAGIDYINLLGSPSTRAILEQQIKSVILRSEGVFALEKFEVTKSANRALLINYSILTANNRIAQQQIEI